ncbi:hypothetical protein GCM10027589_09360 [Actinocorallia lasiicapitis]
MTEIDLERPEQKRSDVTSHGAEDIHIIYEILDDPAEEFRIIKAFCIEKQAQEAMNLLSNPEARHEFQIHPARLGEHIWLGGFFTYEDDDM